MLKYVHTSAHVTEGSMINGIWNEVTIVHGARNGNLCMENRNNALKDASEFVVSLEND